LLGSVTVTSITTTADAVGRVVHLVPQSVVTFTGGSTIANTITTVAGVPVVGIFDGVQWHLK